MLHLQESPNVDSRMTRMESSRKLFSFTTHVSLILMSSFDYLSSLFIHLWCFYILCEGTTSSGLYLPLLDHHLCFPSSASSLFSYKKARIPQGTAGRIWWGGMRKKYELIFKNVTSSSCHAECKDCFFFHHFFPSGCHTQVLKAI